jgi:hypothetical protein
LLKEWQSGEPDINEWRPNYKKLLRIVFKQVMLFYRPDVELAATGLRFFSNELNEEELNFCLNKITPELQPIAESAKLAAIRAIEREDGGITRVLPILLSENCSGKCNVRK